MRWARTAEARAAAQHYMTVRREADRLLAACEASHRDILSHGIDAHRVEAYAHLREAYEDMVEDFGAARAAVARLLAGG